MSGGGFQDMNSKLAHATNAAVTDQMLSAPLPLSHFLKGQKQYSVSGGYSTVDAGVVQLNGNGLTLAFDRAFRDGWGYQFLLLANQHNVGISGNEVLNTPFAKNVPLDLPERAEFSNGKGRITFTALGAALVYDPLLKGKDSQSLPLSFGVQVATMKFDGVSTHYRMTSGTSTGSQGDLDLNGEYSFVMPFFAAHWFFPVRENWLLVPSVRFAKALESVGQKGRMTGPGFDVSGNSEATGYTDANFDLWLVSPGFTISYRPWNLSSNVGASLFRYMMPGLTSDGVNKTVLFSLAWSWSPKSDTVETSPSEKPTLPAPTTPSESAPTDAAPQS